MAIGLTYPRRPAFEGFPRAPAPRQDRRGEVLVVSCGGVESRSSGFGRNRRCQRRFVPLPRDPEKLVPSSHAKPERIPQGLSHHGNLADTIGNAPYTGAAGREECHITLAEPTFFALFSNENLTKDDGNGLILSIMPLEASGTAFPDHNVRSAIVALGQQLGKRLGFAQRIQSVEIDDGTRSVIVTAEPSTIDLDMLSLPEYARADTQHPKC